MSYYRRNRGRLGTAPQPTAQPVTIPASVGGVNALMALSGMAPEEAIYLFNAVPSEYGLRLRKGYREWATGVNGDVRTIVPHDHQTGETGKDKLFAISANGIYDVTAFNTTVPNLEVPFISNGPEAGYCIFANFTTDAEEHILFVADEENGLYQYNGNTEVWSRPIISFPDSTTVNDIAFITVHKQRVWLVKKGSDNAYYLPVDSIAGEAISFNFGSKFPGGGMLRGLWSWTIDGGDGVDDFLIALSGAGDVLVYYGPDPSQPEWSLRGSYFIGQPPRSRRIAEDYGGDLYLLASYGVVSLRDLLNGVDYADVKVGPSGKITRFLREEVREKPASLQWAMHIHPTEGFLQIITPLKNTAAGETDHVQYVQNLLTQAWGWWRDVPMICAANQAGEYFIGSEDGIVYIYDGALDGTKLDSTLGTPIIFGGLTSFQPFGDHGRYMQPGFIRTVGVNSAGTTGITLNVKAVFDYQFDAAIKVPTAPSRTNSRGWDVAQWDVDFWDGSASSGAVDAGAAGWGRTMAIGWRGQAEKRLTITAWDVTATQGGML